MTTLLIEKLTDSDLDDASDLAGRAFAVPTSFRVRLARYLALSPETWLGLRDAAGLVGMVGANLFGTCAYVGLMAVAPRAQRQGHGERLMRALLERLDGSGHDLALLDASDLGAPLYRRLGFVDAGTSTQWDRPAHTAPPPPDLFGPEPPSEKLALHADVLDEVIALDARFFGNERQSMWQRLAAELPDALFGTRDRAGRLTGYLCAQPGLAGPWGASEPAVASSLLRAALTTEALAGPSRVLCATTNQNARRLLEATGFRASRRLFHMRRLAPGAMFSAADAPQLSGWPCIYGKGSFCLG